MELANPEKVILITVFLRAWKYFIAFVLVQVIDIHTCNQLAVLTPVRRYVLHHNAYTHADN